MMELGFFFIGFAIFLLALDAEQLIRTWKEFECKSKDSNKNQDDNG